MSGCCSCGACIAFDVVVAVVVVAVVVGAVVGGCSNIFTFGHVSLKRGW